MWTAIREHEEASVCKKLCSANSDTTRTTCLSMAGIYEKYAQYKKEQKLLDEIVESLKNTILADMEKRNVDKDERLEGTFTVVRTTRWEYTEKVRAMEEKIKIAKTREQEQEKAIPTITESLRYDDVTTTGRRS